MKRGIDYAKQIVNKEILSGELEYLSCVRFLEDLEKDWEYVFDESRAERIIKFIENYCKQSKGVFAGQTITLLPFQVYDLINIFGWVNKKDGARRFTRAFIEMARGNAKSTIMSAIALYGMMSDVIYPPDKPNEILFEKNPQVVCTAYDREQARIVLDEAKTMAQASKEILKRLTVKKGYVEHKQRGGSLKALSKDTRNKDGMNVSIAILDEIHTHRTSEVMDIILSGFGKRVQNLACIITTAGTDAENNIGKKEHDICEKILRKEIIDESYFTVIRQLDLGDDPADESLWIKANPMLRTENDYTIKLKEAIQQNYNIGFGSGDASKKREFLVKRCCLWQTDSDDKFMAGLMDRYKQLEVENFDELIKDRPCWVGVDLSKCRDLTAIGKVWRLEDGRYAVDAHGFMPAERCQEHEHGDRVPYRMWSKDGWVTITPGAVTRISAVEDKVKVIENTQEVCYDPYSGWEFANNLEAEGYLMVEIRQGVNTLSEPTKKFRDLVLEGKIICLLYTSDAARRRG